MKSSRECSDNVNEQAFVPTPGMYLSTQTPGIHAATPDPVRSCTADSVVLYEGTSSQSIAGLNRIAPMWLREWADYNPCYSPIPASFDFTLEVSLQLPVSLSPNSVSTQTHNEPRSCTRQCHPLGYLSLHQTGYGNHPHQNNRHKYLQSAVRETTVRWLAYGSRGAYGGIRR